jgi:hypothetical protein
VHTLKTSVMGALHVLGLAKRLRAPVLQASTSEVYGDPLVHPQPESYWGNVSCTGPRSCYDEAKRFSEALTMAYHRVLDADVRIVRIFNTYGPRMRPDDGRVVGTFIMQALQGEPITLFGDGNQTRSFCYVDDEVRGLVAVMDGDLIGPVNVGNPGEFTMRELAELVIDLTGSSSQIVSVALPPDLLSPLLTAESPGAVGGTVLAGAAGANAVNNLPALLVALDGVDHMTWGMWAWLAGVNTGAVLVPIGALANLLWWRIVRDEGVEVDLRRYLRITVPVALPALAAAAAVVAIGAAIG